MKSVLCSEYLTYDEVMNSRDLFITYGAEGVFFICCDDWYTPKKAKLWYKFSINPFDIDFLKFKKIDYEFIKPKDDPATKGLKYLLKYFNVCNPKYYDCNTNLLNRIFFRGGTLSNGLNSILKLKNKDKYGQNLSKEKIYRLKHKFISCCKTWLKRIFKEYNFLDNSIEYISKYYNDWVILVDMIQNQKPNVVKGVWKFIDTYDINSISEFKEKWIYVLNGEIHIRGVGAQDILDFTNKLKILEE